METPDNIPNSAVKHLYAYDTRNGKVGQAKPFNF